MKTCPVCQKVLTDQAKFCYFCGASLLNPPSDPVVSEPIADEQPIVSEDPIPETPTIPDVTLSDEPIVSDVDIPEAPIVTEDVPNVLSDSFVASEPAPDLLSEQKEPVAAPAPDPVIAQPIHTTEPAPVVAPEPKTVPNDTAKPVLMATDSRSLMTTPGYIFTTILFHIPVIGLIFMIVWGCGKTKNLSRKRFSLACLIMRLLGYFLLLACAVFMLICFSGKFTILTDAFARFFS